jgi:hypothetical protein
MQEDKSGIASEARPTDTNSSSAGEVAEVRYGHEGVKRKLTSRHIQASAKSPTLSQDGTF